MVAKPTDLDSHLLLRLPSVVAYLALPSLWAVLLGLAIITVVLQTISFGTMGVLTALFVAGLEIGVFFQITQSSAQGETTFSAPDFVAIYDSIVHPILLVLAAALPMIAAAYWATMEFVSNPLPNSGWHEGPLALFAAGALLFPLLLTIAAIDRSAGKVLNPRIWVQSLRSLGTDYIVAAAGFYGLWILEAYVFTKMSLGIANIHIFGSSVAGLMLLYVPRVLRYRLLGALCEPFLAEPTEDVASPLPEAVVVADFDDTEDRLAELASGSMAPRAILRMINTAFSRRRYRLVFRSVEHLWKQHQDCPEMAQALWVASQAQIQEGNSKTAKVTLETLIKHDPNHPMASEARIKLRTLSP